MNPIGINPISFIRHKLNKQNKSPKLMDKMTARVATIAFETFLYFIYKIEAISTLIKSIPNKTNRSNSSQSEVFSSVLIGKEEPSTNPGSDQFSPALNENELENIIKNLPPSIEYKNITSLDYNKFYNLQSRVQISDESSAWVSFNRKNCSRTPSINKFHISIAREEKHLTAAFNIIYPILEKHQIISFKILPLEKITVDGNTLGKEFVIYIQPQDKKENDSTFWSDIVLKEIVDSLSRANVKPGPHSTGDIAIKGGHGFVYSRSPYNVFGVYVNADLLKQCEFSHEEAACLSPSEFLDITIKSSEDTVKNEENSTSLPKVIKLADLEKLEKEAPTSDEKKIYKGLINNLGKNYEVYNTRIPFLICLITGTNLEKYCSDKRINILKKFFNFPNRNPDSDRIWNFGQEAILNEEFFKPYLEKAAKRIALLRNSRGIQKTEKLGNILPAIYHHLVVPLSEHGESNLKLTEEEESRLIDEIVLCALR